MKDGSLFCFVGMRSTELGCFRSCSWCLWKALDEGGVHRLWFHDVWTCSAKVLPTGMLEIMFLESLESS
jgi:hypothetical protein